MKEKNDEPDRTPVGILRDSNLSQEFFVQRKLSLPQTLVKRFFPKILLGRTQKHYVFFLLKDGIKPKQAATLLEGEGYHSHGNRTVCFDSSLIKAVHISMYVYCHPLKGIFFCYFCQDPVKFASLHNGGEIKLHQKGSNLSLKSKFVKKNEIDFGSPDNLGIGS